MKVQRKWAWLLAIAMVVSCLSGYSGVEVQAEDAITAMIASTADLQYVINPDNTVTVTKYVGRTDGEWTNVALPATIDGCRVTQVQGAFEGLSMQCVVLPENVKVIGEKTFKDCKNLTRIMTYSDASLTDGISAAASGGAVSSQAIGRLQLDSALFKDTAHGKSNTYFAPDSITTIASYAFQGCDNIHIYVFPASLTTLSSFSFLNAQNMNYVDLSETNIVRIPSYAFRDCNNLHQVDMPESLDVIENYGFFSCNNLNSMKMPATMSAIGAGAFQGCQNLHSITVPEGITSVEPGTFDGCQNLNDVKLPSTLKEIKDNAFNGCNNIHNINVPAGVKVSGNSGLNYKKPPVPKPSPKVTVGKTKIKKLKAVKKKVKKKGKKKKVRGVQITWKKVAGASGYIIYRKVGKKKFKLLTIIKKGGKKKYVDTKKIKKKKKYTYVILPYKTVYNRNYYGTKSKAKKIKIRK